MKSVRHRFLSMTSLFFCLFVYHGNASENDNVPDPNSASPPTAQESVQITGNQRAIADFSRAIELNPKSVPAYVNRGTAKQNEGDLDGAIADFNQAIELDPRIALAYNNRGNAKQAKGDLDGAIADFNQAIELARKYVLAYNNRGIAKQAKGELVGAVADYDQAIELDPQNVNAYKRRGSVENEMRNWTDALADYRRACELSKMDQDFYPYLYVWLIRARLGETEAANKEILSAYLEKRSNSRSEDWVSKVAGHLLGTVAEADLFAAAASPNAQKDSYQHCQAWFFAGMKKLLGGDKETAADYFRKCLATNQNTYIEYRLAKAELIALGQGAAFTADTTSVSPNEPAMTRDGEAIVPNSIAPTAQASPPEDTNQSALKYLQQGGAKQNKHDPEGASADYSRAIELDPKLFTAYLNRGSIKRDKGDLEGAIADYSRVIELMPHPPFYSYRGDAELKKGDLDAAIADFNRAIELNPKYTRAYQMRAEAKRQKGDCQGANEDLRKASQLESVAPTEQASAPVASGQSATQYLQQGNAKLSKRDLPGAIADFSSAITLNPKDTEAYNKRADAKSGIKDYSGAIADYNTAIALNPKDANYIGLGNAKKCLNDIDGAISDYKKDIDLYTLHPEAYHQSWTPLVNLQQHMAIVYVNLSLTKQKKGDYQGANKDARMAVRLWPERYQLNNNQIQVILPKIER